LRRAGAWAHEGCDVKRALLLLLLLTAPASAQQWNPNSGWESDFDRQVQQQQDDFNRRVAENHRQFEESSKKMDEDFNRSTKIFWVFFVGILVLGVGGAIAQGAKRRRQMRYTPIGDAVIESAYVAQVPSGNVDVSVLRLALDGRAGKLVASELDRLTKQFDGSSADSRSQFLRELGIVLRRVRASWLYGGAVNEPMRSMGEARAVAAKHTDDARVHGSDPGDGTGLLVVTVVLTARGELMSVDHIGAEELRRALESASYRDPNELIEIQIVARRFSSRDELEQSYPSPQLVTLLAPVAGQIYCSFCGGPFPQELTTCPHCGAPAKRERAA
jgi:hypothetical protein